MCHSLRLMVYLLLVIRDRMQLSHIIKHLTTDSVTICVRLASMVDRAQKGPITQVTHDRIPIISKMIPPMKLLNNVIFGHASLL